MSATDSDPVGHCSFGKTMCMPNEVHMFNLKSEQYILHVGNTFTFNFKLVIP